MTVELKLVAAFTVPVVGPVILAVNASGEIVMSWKVLAVAPLRSVTVSVTL